MISYKQLDLKIKNNFSKNLKRYLYITSIVLVIILIACFVHHYPYYLTFEYWSDDKNLNRSETIRNLGLILLGIFALIVAIWRALVASKELENSKIKINQEKLHKAVELLESKSERNKISAFVMLSELLSDSKVFDDIIFQILRSYLQEYSNVKKEFLNYKDFEVKEKIAKWYEREIINYSISLCFENYVKLFDKKRVNINSNQILLFHNLNLHGLNLKMPNCLIQSSDLSQCTIYCDKNTKFSHCDLTGAIVIPYKNNTLIFDYCNISHLRLEIPDHIDPLLNGWCWQDCPPKISSFFRYLTLPENRRVIIMPSNRTVDSCLKDNFYREEKYQTEPPFGSFSPLLDDKLEYDTSKQKIISELDYKESNKASDDE